MKYDEIPDVEVSEPVWLDEDPQVEEQPEEPAAEEANEFPGYVEWELSKHKKTMELMRFVAQMSPVEKQWIKRYLVMFYNVEHNPNMVDAVMTL